MTAHHANNCEGKNFRLEFLHIPKTGGSAVKYALSDYASEGADCITFHKHKTRLSDIEVGRSIGLIVRDPVSRFVSAFYSRKRQGRPRYNSAWNATECRVFEVFETPCDLAEALGDAGNLKHPLALQAMEDIGHFRKLSFWLGDTESLKSRLDDISFVGFQESLGEDFERLKHLVGVPIYIELPSDKTLAHRNPSDVDKFLSEEATDAIQAWYQEDYALIEVLRTHCMRNLICNSSHEVRMDGQDSSVESFLEKQSSDRDKSVGESHSVVTVLGSGRSGTSLLMQVLCELGMSTGNASMVPASGANTEGFLEDAEIVEVHKKLLESLQATAVSPLPADWLKMRGAQNASKALSQIIHKRLNHAGKSIWGFKDPRTNSFLPLWVKLFNQPGLSPRYLLAVRDPAAVLASMREYGSPNDKYSELVWLRRNVEALHNTAGNCYIVHYEDWFERPDEVVKGLLAYTGLDKTFQGDISEVISRVVKGRLNRAPRQHQDVQVNNPCVIELYDKLRKCRGQDFDHAALMDSVERARKTIFAFEPEVNLYREKKSDVPPQQKAAEKTAEKAAEKAEIAALTQENGRLLQELTAVTKEAESLRTNLYVKQRTTTKPKKKPDTTSPVANNAQGQQVQRLRREIKSIRQSYTFKIGWVIVNAIKKPGMNTIKAPFRLAKLLVKYVRSKK